MKTLFLSSLLVFGCASSSFAQFIDVNQPLSTMAVAQMDSTGVGQTFIPTEYTCSGAGVRMGNFGTGGQLAIEQWTDLPTQGGVMIASGDTGASNAMPNAWVDIS